MFGFCFFSVRLLFALGVVGERSRQQHGAVVGDETPQQDRRLDLVDAAEDKIRVKVHGKRQLSAAGSAGKRHEIRGKEYKALNTDEVEEIADRHAGCPCRRRHIKGDIDEERHAQNAGELQADQRDDLEHPLFILHQHAVRRVEHAEFSGDLADLRVRILYEGERHQDPVNQPDQLFGDIFRKADHQHEHRHADLRHKAEHDERRRPKVGERRLKVAELYDHGKYAEKGRDELKDNELLRQTGGSEADPHIFL